MKITENKQIHKLENLSKNETKMTKIKIPQLFPKFISPNKKTMKTHSLVAPLVCTPIANESSPKDRYNATVSNRQTQPGFFDGQWK